MRPPTSKMVTSTNTITAATTVQPYAVRSYWHWMEGLEVISRVLQGLFGVRIPLVVDGPQLTAYADIGAARGALGG